MSILKLIFDAIRDGQHNRRLYRDGKVNPNKIVVTTIGWRPDPINQDDGFTQVEGETKSGNAEYTRVIRDRSKGNEHKHS